MTVKGCNHLWDKDPKDGRYHCCICGDTRDTTPPEMIKQSKLGLGEDSGGDRM